MLHLLSRLLIASLALLSCGAFAADGVTPRQILIGQNITLQGGKNDYGTAVQAGIQAYLQAINTRGGVNGRQIVLKTLDDDNQSARAEANARQLIEQDKAFILFGSIEGGPSTAVMKAAVDLKVPFFGPMAGSPTLRRPHQPLVFPVRAEHREEFRALLDYARKTGASRVAFVRSDSETGLQHLENMKLLCSELGLELVLDLSFKSDITDAQIAEMAGRIGAANAQIVLNHGGTGMYERLIRQARAQGVRASFSGVNSGSAQMARHLGELAHGMVFAQVVPSPIERKHAISREFQAAMARSRPGVALGYGGLEGFLTAKALVMALQATGRDLTRATFVGALERSNFDLGGVNVRYSKQSHEGSRFVDLSMFSREDRFIH
jgi:branched-chain amino acid transport system substrate-binding protein